MVQTVMGTAKLFTSGATSAATFSVAVVAAPLFFSLLATSGSALAPYVKENILPLPLLLLNFFQDFFDSHFHTLPFGVFTLRFFHSAVVTTLF